MKWISIKERLPEEADDYLVCFKGHGEVAIVYFGPEYSEWDTNFEPRENFMAFLTEDPFDEGTFTNDITDDIIAWMPLPEPYKEDEV